MQSHSQTTHAKVSPFGSSPTQAGVHSADSEILRRIDPPSQSAEVGARAGEESLEPSTFVRFFTQNRVVLSKLIFIFVSAIALRERNPGWFKGTWQNVVGMAGTVMVVSGIGIRSLAAGVLKKNTSLATDGPYRLCRHPLYLGSALLMFGFLVLVNTTWWNFLVIPLMFAMYTATIRKEERKLRAKFGETWQTYASSVPAMIPLRWVGNVTSSWSPAIWRKNREYRAAIAASVGLMVAWYWRVGF